MFTIVIFSKKGKLLTIQHVSEETVRIQKRWLDKTSAIYFIVYTGSLTQATIMG